MYSTFANLYSTNIPSARFELTRNELSSLHNLRALLSDTRFSDIALKRNSTPSIRCDCFLQVDLYGNLIIHTTSEYLLVKRKYNNFVDYIESTFTLSYIIIIIIIIIVLSFSSLTYKICHILYFVLHRQIH